MDSGEVERAIGAAMHTATALGLEAENATLLHNSNRVALRLAPCDVLARVAPLGGNATFEVGIARQLTEVAAPTGALDPRVEPGVYERDGFAVTLWSYYEPVPGGLAPAEYADALHRLHAAMRSLNTTTPHFLDRVGAAEHSAANRDLSPELVPADRALLIGALQEAKQAVLDHRAAEQLLHGEPHPGNVLRTADGPVFIDVETCCRGPVELDLAYVPEPVCERYPDVDEGLLRDCRHLALAMVAAWRWERDDQLPNGEEVGWELLRVLRAGSPWPTLDAVFGPPSRS